MDTFTRATQTTQHSSTSTTTPHSPTTCYSPSIETTSDPLQQWLVFSPEQEQEQEQQEEEITTTTLPSHDGRGRFFTSSSTHSESSSDHSFSYINYEPNSSSSIVSLSSQAEDDDLLSIPSSISANLSISRRSSASASNYQQQALPHSLMTTEDSELLFNPMAISAGLTNPTEAKLTRSSRLSSSIHSSHHQDSNSIRNEPTDLIAHRVKPPPLSLSSHHQLQTYPSVVLPPSDKQDAHQQKNDSPQMLNFLSNVAYKLLDIHPDTLHLFSSSQHVQIHDQTLSNQLIKNHSKKENTFRAKRFMIGDGDSDRMRMEETQDDEIHSPLDLSGFNGPTKKTSHDEYYNHVSSSSLSSLLTKKQEGILHRTDSCETFKSNHSHHSHRFEESKKSIKKSLSDDHFNPTSLHPSSLSSSSSSSDDDQLYNHHSHAGIQNSSSSSSIAGILIRKVWNDWTNWDIN